MDGWKITAIIFIIIAIAEFSLLAWWWNVGTAYIENEETCAYEICDLDESYDYDAYFYDDYDNTCYCYIDNEVAKVKYIG